MVWQLLLNKNRLVLLGAKDYLTWVQNSDLSFCSAKQPSLFLLSKQPYSQEKKQQSTFLNEALLNLKIKVAFSFSFWDSLTCHQTRAALSPFCSEKSVILRIVWSVESCNFLANLSRSAFCRCYIRKVDKYKFACFIVALLSFDIFLPKN